MKSKPSKPAKPKITLKGELLPMPENVQPMLASLIDTIVEGEDWVYELKWDGYRALAYIGGNSLEIRSRNNKSFNEKFYPIYQALAKWKTKALVDGEIVVINQKGLPDFGDLQLWRSEADGQLVFYLFDILWLDGRSLMNIPLSKRREILKAVAPSNNPSIRVSENFNASGKEFFELADRMGLEGIMAKKSSSLYTPGLRTKEWLKIKTEKRQEMIIGGYTINENTTKPFSALLMGIVENGGFQFLTPVGTGFNVKTQNEIIQKLKKYETAKCPFTAVPEYNKPSRFRPNPPKAAVVWVKPKLVAEISYREMTKEGAVRHPSFKGLRTDKDPLDVVREKPVTVPVERPDQDHLEKRNVLAAPSKSERKTLVNPKEESQTRSIGGHELKFGNLSKLYWPKEKISKRDMLNYYYQVAPYMLPYYKDKPQTLYRFPHGIEGEAFYQKDVKGKAPEWIKTFPYFSHADNREKEFLVITNEASLLYVASLGCIEINPWSSRIQKPDNPDWCIIDLDPDKTNTFNQVIDVAQVTKKILDAIGVPSYPKTSGSSGLHIYIPFGAKYDYEDSKEFARIIARLVQEQLPKFTSIERKVADRNGKMYIDFLQNRPQATVAGPYSLRPKPGAPVSMPLHWEEVKKGLKIRDFHIKNSVDRLKEQGDIFKPVLGKGIALDKTLKAITTVFS